MRELKQQTFISHSSGGWEVQDQGVQYIQCLVNTSFLVPRWAVFLLCLHMVEGARGFSEVLYKRTKPIHEDSAVMTSSPS